MNGKAVSNAPGTASSFEANMGLKTQPVTESISSQSVTDKRDEERRSSTEGAPVIRTPEEEEPDQRAVLDSMAHAGPGEHRDIECRKCGHVHNIPANAANALCPRCDEFVSLKNYDIQGVWNRPISTSGNVFVHRGGRIEDVHVECHNLTVEGEFVGSTECSGDFVIRSSGRILGRVKCRRLIIERQAKIEFANSVSADEVSIDGSVQADIRCRGKLTLEPNATLKGDIKVHSLSISEGAQHSGLVSVGHTGS